MTLIAGDHACAAGALIQRDGRVGVCGLQAGHHQAAIGGCSGWILAACSSSKTCTNRSYGIKDILCARNDVGPCPIRKPWVAAVGFPSSHTCTMGQQ